LKVGKWVERRREEKTKRLRTKRLRAGVCRGGSRQREVAAATEGKRRDERQSEVSRQLARDARPASKTRLTGVSGKNRRELKAGDQETKSLRD